MEINKHACLSDAIAIVKEYARGGGGGSIAGTLESVYEKLKELRTDVES